MIERRCVFECFGECRRFAFQTHGTRSRINGDRQEEYRWLRDAFDRTKYWQPRLTQLRNDSLEAAALGRDWRGTRELALSLFFGLQTCAHRSFVFSALKRPFPIEVHYRSDGTDTKCKDEPSDRRRGIGLEEVDRRIAHAICPCSSDAPRADAGTLEDGAAMETHVTPVGASRPSPIGASSQPATTTGALTAVMP